MTPQTPPGQEDSIPDKRTTRNERAVSDLIGFILIFALVVSVVAIVSLAGMNSLESARDAEQSNNAVRALEVLSDNMADIHDRGAPSRATEISLQGASMRLGEETEIVVRDPNESVSDPSFQSSLVYETRPIIYDDGDTQLVYVMGAVFREQREGGTIVQSWSPILERDRTLVPVISTVSATSSGQNLQSSTVLVRGVVSDRRVAVADSGPTYDDVWINVSSPRNGLWKRMLDEQPELSCSANGPEWVNCSLGYTPERLYVPETRIAVELAE